MSNNQHTPGPWYYEEANIRNEDGLDVATIDTERSTSRSQYDPVPEEEWIANTHLIAAAPELLKTCRVLLERAQQLSAGTKAIDGLIPDARMDLELDIEDASKLIDRIEGGAE